MVKPKRFLPLLVVCTLASAEAPPPGQPQAQQPMQVQIAPPPPAPDRIKIFDDRVFDLSGGTNEPTTRTSAGGNTRYLDKDKELDYNTEQRDRWMKNCASLKETDYKAYSQCFEAQKKKETGSRTNFGMREPRSGSDGVNAPPPKQMPSDLKPKDAEPQESGDAENE